MDISLVLNVHNESGYLRRTLIALEKAAHYARARNIAIELIAVLDRPDAATIDWVRSYDFAAFDAHQICSVDNGSLGPSRNDGIRLARGDYIALCDADDLVSYNFYVEHYAVASANGRKTIVLPEYCYLFGNYTHLYKLLGTGTVSKLAFFGYHPYISRIFAHRSLFDLLQFCDLPLTSGYAYEDWHLHCEAVASGCEFVSATGTIFYYRKRRNSLLRLADSVSTRVIPFTRLFEPQVFVKTCASDYARFVRNDLPAPPSSIGEDFLADNRCVELTYAANEIDPAIDISRIATAPAFSNLGGDLRAGAIYYELCNTISCARFTDVILLPALSHGTSDADRYIVSVLKGIRQLRPEATFLILVAQRDEDQEGDVDPPGAVSDLPEGAVSIDLSRVCAGCDDEVLCTLTLRLIQAAAPRGRIHMRQSRYSLEFFRRFGWILKDNLRIYYRFFDPPIQEGGVWFKRGAEFDFLSELGDHVDTILTDNFAVASHDRARLDTLSGKIHTLHAPCDMVGMAPRAGVTCRFLWALQSPIESQPNLFGAFAQRLAQEIPSARIDVFQQAGAGQFDVQKCKGHENLSFRGEYSELQAVHPERYDALLYTSISDGLPHAIVQALALGLPVIAPDVGGLAEAITPESGFLIEHDSDEERLVASYVRAMARACDPANAAEMEAMRRAGYELVRTQHSKQAFVSRLAGVLRLEAEA